MRLIQPGQTIVVGVSCDQASGVALRRAFALARLFDADLRIVHALVWGQPPLVLTEKDAAASVATWAVREASLFISELDLVVTVEAPASAIARAARESNAALVVLGASRPRLTTGVAERTMQRVRCPVLVAQPPRRASEVVAATDLRDRRFPVVHAAASLADACAARVTLVHNLEEAPASHESRRKLVWPALRDLLALLSRVATVRQAHLATVPSTAGAIADVVKERAADIVAVGIRSGHRSIIGELLASTSSSVLAIPLRNR